MLIITVVFVFMKIGSTRFCNGHRLTDRTISMANGEAIKFISNDDGLNGPGFRIKVDKIGECINDFPSRNEFLFMIQG